MRQHKFVPKEVVSVNEFDTLAVVLGMSDKTDYLAFLHEMHALRILQRLF